MNEDGILEGLTPEDIKAVEQHITKESIEWVEEKQLVLDWYELVFKWKEGNCIRGMNLFIPAKSYNQANEFAKNVADMLDLGKHKLSIEKKDTYEEK